MALIAYNQPNADAPFNERQEQIVELVRASGYATVESLAERFGVSTQTIRRDVVRLDKAGLLQRFHGGAGLPEDRVRLGYREKQEQAVVAKARIGEMAAALVPDDASVYLDVGTTADAVARALLSRRVRAVHTSNMSAALILAGAPGIETYVTGGCVRGTDGSLVGDQVTRALAAISVEIAFIGCSGFESDASPTDFDPQKVAVKQRVIGNARRVILIADAQKFERRADVRIAGIDAFTDAITDRSPGTSFLAACRTAGCRVWVTLGD